MVTCLKCITHFSLQLSKQMASLSRNISPNTGSWIIEFPNQTHSSHYSNSWRGHSIYVIAIHLSWRDTLRRTADSIAHLVRKFIFKLYNLLPEV
jgi:hypothetical protein